VFIGERIIYAGIEIKAMKSLFFTILILLMIAGCRIQEKEIPFFKQTDSGNCLQTNLKMALKYDYP